MTEPWPILVEPEAANFGIPTSRNKREKWGTQILRPT